MASAAVVRHGRMVQRSAGPECILLESTTTGEGRENETNIKFVSFGVASKVKVDLGYLEYFEALHMFEVGRFGGGARRAVSGGGYAT